MRLFFFSSFAIKIQHLTGDTPKWPAVSCRSFVVRAGGLGPKLWVRCSVLAANLWDSGSIHDSVHVGRMFHPICLIKSTALLSTVV